MNPISLTTIKRRGRPFLKRLAAVFAAAAMIPAAALPASADGMDELIGRVRPDLRLVRQYAAQILADNQMADYTRGGFTWDTEKRPAGWLYYNGFMLDALLRLNADGSRQMAEAFFHDHILPDGSVAGYREGWLDSVEPARALLRVLADDADMTEAYLPAVRWVWSRLESQRTYPACGSNFLHAQDEKGSPAPNFRRYPILLDGLYMTQPFLAGCAALIRSGTLTLTDAKGRTVTAEALEQGIAARYVWIQSYMYDRGKKLYQHGWDVSSSRGNGHYWARGIGWLAMSMADVIELLPEDAAKTRMQGILIQLLDGMLTYQDADSGMWYNVVDRGPELPDNRTETSATCMMAYTLVKVWNDGYAPGDHYLESGLRAFHGVAETKIIIQDGTIHLLDIYLKSAAGDSDEYYCREAYTADEAKGAAALLMAAAEIEEAVSAYAGK